MSPEEYHSKSEIEKKFVQSKYALKQFNRFKNRVFVGNGIDKETGTYPIQIYFNSFLSHTRSVFQYAYKEAELNGKVRMYEDFVKKHGIFKFFTMLRDCDIHEYTLTTAVNLFGDSPIEKYIRKEGKLFGVGKPVSLLVESLDALDRPKGINKEFKIVTSIGKRIPVTTHLINDLEKAGKKELIQAAKEGKTLYQEQFYEDENDIFILCDMYMEEIEQFIEFGIETNFIT